MDKEKEASLAEVVAGMWRYWRLMLGVFLVPVVVVGGYGVFKDHDKQQHHSIYQIATASAHVPLLPERNILSRLDGLYIPAALAEQDATMTVSAQLERGSQLLHLRSVAETEVAVAQVRAVHETVLARLGAAEQERLLPLGGGLAASSEHFYLSLPRAGEVLQLAEPSPASKRRRLIWPLLGVLLGGMLAIFTASMAVLGRQVRDELRG